MKRFSIICFLIAIQTWSSLLPAQISETRYDFSDVAIQITKGAHTPTEVARSIYQWICANISYDTTYQYYSADECWENKSAVCQGYCELFYHLGKVLGLRTHIITGYSKGLHGEINPNKHAWISVETEKGTLLLDPTWGAGSIIEGKFIRNKNDFSWFDVDPHWLIFTHYPDHTEHQYLSTPIDWDTFVNLPVLYPSFSEYGLDGRKLLMHSLSAKGTSFPRVFERFSKHLTLIDIPIQETLRAGNFYRFILKKKQSNELVLIHDNEFIHQDQWQVTDSCYMLEYMPTAAGELHLAIGQSGHNYQAAISYDVSPPDSIGLANIEKYFPLKMPEMKHIKNLNAQNWASIGVNGHALLQHVRETHASSLPILYKQAKTYLRKSNIPFSETLQVGHSYFFSFLPQGGLDWQIINEKDWYNTWTIDKSTGLYTIQITPQNEGNLRISVKITENGPYQSLVGYKVLGNDKK